MLCAVPAASPSPGGLRGRAGRGGSAPGSDRKRAGGGHLDGRVVLVTAVAGIAARPRADAHDGPEHKPGPARHPRRRAPRHPKPRCAASRRAWAKSCSTSQLRITTYGSILMAEASSICSIPVPSRKELRRQPYGRRWLQSWWASGGSASAPLPVPALEMTNTAAD
jgi:hypothetical protein